MKRVIKLTESDIARIVRRVIKENETSGNILQDCIKSEIQKRLGGKNMNIDPTDLLDFVQACNPGKPTSIISCPLKTAELTEKYGNIMLEVAKLTAEFPKILATCNKPVMY